MELVITILPYSCSTMYFCAALEHRKLPLRWMSSTVSQSSSLILKARLSRKTPALLTRMSIRPKRLAISSKAASTWWALDTSHATASPSAPAASTASTVSREASAERSSTATLAPSCASRIASAAPMPRAAPVTTATRPLSLTYLPFSQIHLSRSITKPPPLEAGAGDPGRGSWSSGTDIDPAVYVDGLAGNVVAVFDEVADGAGNLFGLTEAPQGHKLEQLLLLLFRDAGDHIRLYEAGADRVDRDAVAGQLLGGRLGKAEQPRLGCRVVCLADVARLADEGAHVDDLASTLLHHVLQRRVHRVEGAVQVDLDDLVPVLHRELPQGAVYVYAGVVDEHVYPVELFYRLVYEALGLLGVRDVRLYRYGVHPIVLELVDHLFRRLLAARVVDHDARPAPPQFLHYGATQSPARPRYDHHRLLQSAHRHLPSLVNLLQPKFIDAKDPFQTMYSAHINGGDLAPKPDELRSPLAHHFSTIKGKFGDWVRSKVTWGR